MTADVGRRVGGTAARTHAPAWAWYGLAVLVLAYVLAFVDRQILSLLVEPLKRDLALDDTRVSLLQGLAFAAFLGVAGLPIARLIDRGRRMMIVAAGVALWSLMTAACGMASSFEVLLLCRMGVGVGEAVLTPAAHSVIADSFPPNRLGLALGLYGAGAFVGMGLAYGVGAAALAALAGHPSLSLSFVGAIRPWQAAFLAAALPGLPLALWIATLREPSRRLRRPEAPSNRDVAGFFVARRGVIGSVNLCLAFAAMAGYGLSAWAPSLFIRTYGWTAPHAGAALGLMVAPTGVLASLAGGLAADRAARRVPGGRLLTMACSAALAAPFALAAGLAPDASLAILALGGHVFFSTAAISIGPSVQQAMTPPAMRGVMSSVGVLTVSLLGLGAGPTAIALVTDHVFGDPQRLRYSIALLAPAMLLVSAAIGFRGLRAYAAASAPGDCSMWSIRPAARAWPRRCR